MCVDSSDIRESEPTGFACRSGKKPKRVPEFRAEQLEWKCGLWGTLEDRRVNSQSAVGGRLHLEFS